MHGTDRLPQRHLQELSEMQAAPLKDLRHDYRIVVADPPWNFKSNSTAKPGRNPRRHYDCMALADIGVLPVKDHLADDAALFLWVPGPFLVLGAHVPLMEAWGFKPSGMGFVWIKLRPKASHYYFLSAISRWAAVSRRARMPSFA
jgi:N6-adenosine-specific RNA methylase IME4